jgi:low temperature requirement protein LtrA
MKSRKRPVSPFLTKEDQPVSFAELFFDLVFVYAITQVVELMHGGFDLAERADCNPGILAGMVGMDTILMGAQRS